jgi:hypothetical protein
MLFNFWFPLSSVGTNSRLYLNQNLRCNTKLIYRKILDSYDF